MARETRSRRSAVLKVGAAVLIALALLLVLAIPLLRSDRVIAQLTQRVLPKVSESLGREVTVDGASIELFPRIQIALRGLKVAGAPGEPPLIEAETASAKPKVWRLIRSLGSDLAIDGLRIDNAKIALVKRPDGEWSYEDLGSSGAPAEGGEGAAVAQAAPVAEEESVAWSLHNLELSNADIRMIDRSEAPAKELRLPGLTLHMTEVAFGRPLEGTVTGTLGAERKNLDGAFRLDRLPASFDTLAPRDYPKLSGQIRLDGVPLTVLQSYLPSGFSELVTGGAVFGEAALSSAPTGEWVFAGPVRVEQMSLRGQPATARTEMKMLLPAWNPDAFAVDLQGLAVKGPGVDLGGSARVDGQPMKVTFELQGDLLDLDALLAALPAEAAPASGTGGSGGEGAAPEGAPATPAAPLVSASARESLMTTAANGTLRIGRVVRGKLEANGLEARATLKGGVLTLEQAGAGFFGGRMDLTGTTIDVSQPTPKWNLVAGLEGVNLGAAMAAVGGKAAVEGLAQGKLQLTGAGNDWAALVKTLVGQGRMLISEGSLPAMDLAEKVTGPLSSLVPGGRLQALAEQAQGTTLKDLAASFQVKDGWLLLTRPLNVQTRVGQASLGGRIGLDQQLALEGQVNLTPQFVAQVSGGRLTPGKPVPVPLQIGGTLKAPAVDAAAPRDAVRGAVEQKVRDRVQDELKDRARQLIPDLRR